MTGIYLLLIGLPEDAAIRVRSGRRFALKKGFYIYAGSAMNGLEARLRRHVGARKKLFWHIDFLLQHGSVLKIIVAGTRSRLECAVARALARRLPPIPGFGCSDCRCTSHLLFSEHVVGLAEMAVEILKEVGLQSIETTNRPWTNLRR